MIRYNPKEWFGLIFKLHKSDALISSFKTLLLFALYTLIIVYLEIHYTDFKSTIEIHSLLGFVIGLLLVFRTNTAYERWWEGRRQWGKLINVSRNLALKVNSMLINKEDKKFYCNMISNYAYSVRNHLRYNKDTENIIFFNDFEINEINDIQHIPNKISGIVYKKTNELYKENKISGYQLIIIEDEIKELSNVLGSCERIRNTPIPYSYNMFLKTFIFMYTITMPFGLVYDYNYWSIPIATFILYVFSSLELLAEEIEDPFGNDANDLPLDNLCNQIKENMNEILS